MRCPADNGDPVKDPAVNIGLVGQASERVAVALYFVSIKLAVDNGNVNPGIVLAQAQFLDDQRPCIAGVFGGEQLP
jgi:hypothetical protein